MDITDSFLTYAGWTVWVWLPPSIVLGIATVWSFGGRTAEVVVRPPVTELWLALLIPAVSLLWGAVAYEYAAAPRGAPTPERSHWAFYVLDALTVLSVVVSVFLVYRHRRRRALSVSIALFAIAFALFSWFIASMSIGNDWI